MKTITENSTNLSLYVYNDNRTVTIGSDKTVVSATSSDKYEVIEENILMDVKSGTHTLHTGVTEPSNWVGNKYTFDGSAWALNTAFKIACEDCNTRNVLTLNNYDATTCSECATAL